MRMLFKAAIYLCALAPVAASAGIMPLTYELNSYSQGNFSANWLHSADGCRGGPDNNLFMCNGSTADSFLLGIEGGRFSGDYDGGELTNIAGYFRLQPNTLFNDMTITGGALGGSDWYLDYTLHGGQSTHTGRFFFEQLDMGTGLPNSYALPELVLWGQNQDAYAAAAVNSPGPVNAHYRPIGIDLYAVSVPEPGTLALLGVGLAGLGFARRRRPVRASRA